MWAMDIQPKGMSWPAQQSIFCKTFATRRDAESVDVPGLGLKDTIGSAKRAETRPIRALGGFILDSWRRARRL
jgi:hypothetical protein